MDNYLPEQEEPQDQVVVSEYDDEAPREYNDGANGYDDGDDIEEDDGQPDEYTEWQDYMGGDDWDYGQCDY